METYIAEACSLNFILSGSIVGEFSAHPLVLIGSKQTCMRYAYILLIFVNLSLGVIKLYIFLNLKKNGCFMQLNL